MRIPFTSSIFSPKSQQVAAFWRDKILTGKIDSGAKMPSIEMLSRVNGIAKDTVEKAYRILSEEGLIIRVRAKGCFVQKQQNTAIRAAYITCSLSKFQTRIYQNLRESLPAQIQLDMALYHGSSTVLKRWIGQHAASYERIIFGGDWTAAKNINKLEEALRQLPAEKLMVVGGCSNFSGYFHGAVIDYRLGIFNELSKNAELGIRYNTVEVITNGDGPLPGSFYEGMKDFCLAYGLEISIVNRVPEKLTRNRLYLCLMDEDVYHLIENAVAGDFCLGADFGLLAYTDSSFKKRKKIGFIQDDLRQVGEAVKAWASGAPSGKVHASPLSISFRQSC